VNIFRQLQTAGGHPYIVKLLDVGTGTEYLFTILEYCSGGDLFNHLKTVGRMPIREVRIVIGQLLDAVDFLHAHHIAHLDITPENILLDTWGNIKLCDFSLSVAMTRWTPLKGRIGKEPYMAPEVFANFSFDARLADMWSVGIILFTSLVGTTPWKTPDTSDKFFTAYCQGRLTEQLADWETCVPPEAFDLFVRLCSLNPQFRFSCKEEIMKHPFFTTLAG
jgi:serine/threonine-protein kinase Chk1